jgi:hypothetical protein
MIVRALAMLLAFVIVALPAFLIMLLSAWIVGDYIPYRSAGLASVIMGLFFTIFSFVVSKEDIFKELR